MTPTDISLTVTAASVNVVATGTAASASEASAVSSTLGALDTTSASPQVGVTVESVSTPRVLSPRPRPCRRPHASRLRSKRMSTSGISRGTSPRPRATAGAWGSAKRDYTRLRARQTPNPSATPTETTSSTSPTRTATGWFTTARPASNACCTHPMVCTRSRGTAASSARR